MGEEDQISLEGFVVLRLEDLEEAVERVLQKHEILGLAKRIASWDREYKGDEPWLEFRALVIQLVRRNLAVKYGHLNQAPRVKEVVNIYTSEQWKRAMNQHLITNDPEGPDDYKFAAFQFGDRGTWWLTFKGWLHCAIAKAGQSRRDARKAIVENRQLYGVEDPEACGYCALRQAETVEEDFQSPVRKHDAQGLTDEEKQVVTAAKAEE
ncbi:MAG: hypothetical protein V3U30_04170 [Thermoplasmata archaeon]